MKHPRLLLEHVLQGPWRGNSRILKLTKIRVQAPVLGLPWLALLPELRETEAAPPPGPGVGGVVEGCPSAGTAPLCTEALRHFCLVWVGLGERGGFSWELGSGRWCEGFLSHSLQHSFTTCFSQNIFRLSSSHILDVYCKLMSPESQQQPSSGQSTFQNHLDGEKKGKY